MNPNPTITLFSGGDLTVGGVLHAGLNDARTGNLSLTAQDVLINGALYAANAGAVGVTANSGSIEVPGAIWGNGPPAGQQPTWPAW